MAKTLERARVQTGEIFFELERFEAGDGDRLELCGRWFGVRGRRFVRPTLTLLADGEQLRSLADIEHKPWAAEDGEPWQAAFPRRGDGAVRAAELSVAPDITVRLPAPSAEPADAGAPQRIAAMPRPRGSGRAQVPAGSSARADPSEPAPQTELEAVRRELEAARRELSEARDATAQLREQLGRSVAAKDEAEAALEEAKVEAAGERDHLTAARERAASERDQTGAALEQAATDRDRTQQALDQALRERDELARAVEQLRDEREELARSNERLVAELGEAISSRGAALVMRNAAQTSHDRGGGWIQRSFAVVVLLGALFALLIVLHLL